MIAKGDFTMEGLTKKLSEYIANETLHTIPPHIKTEIKRRILDYCGVVLAGSIRMESKILHKIMKEMGGVEESTFFGYGDKTSCMNAALANGTTSHITELGDWTKYLMHPGETVLSAAFALGEREHVSGKTFMNAAVVGYETELRIALAGNPGIRMRGFHTIGTVGPFGAAAACSKILGFDADLIEQCLGLAGSQSAGLLIFLEGGGAMSKRLQSGKANSSGLLAALLSKEGFVGPRRILESDKGFFKAFVHWNEYPYHLERVLDGLGKRYEIMNTNIKLHSCCGPLHPGLDALEALVKENTIQEENIEKIVVRSFLNAVDGHEEITPDTVVGATMSYPYCIAAMLMTGRVLVTEFTEEKLKDREFMIQVEKIGRKCEIILDPEIDKKYPEKYSALVRVIMKDGKAYERLVENPKGFYPENPVSDEQLRSKFRVLANLVLADEETESIIGVVDKLEELNDINELTKLMYCKKVSEDRR
jgi:2-methylcitrate dehydratase PrpD